MDKNRKKGATEEEKIWNDTEDKILKRWAEQAASYRVLHNRSYRKYKWLTGIFTIPVIIISTLTGTANFSQGTLIQIYPSIDVYLPLFIGALNLISGILTTIGQFLRVSELNEAHRSASISYGKFSRNISTELSLPPNERTYNGIDFIQICRNEMDRLIEQSPEISMKIIRKFEKNRKFLNIVKPELINISNIEVYKPTKKEIDKEVLSDAATQYRQKLIQSKIPVPEAFENSLSKNIEFNNRKNRELELSKIRSGGVVKNFDNKNELGAVFNNTVLNNKTEDNENDSYIVDISKVKEMYENQKNNGIGLGHPSCDVKVTHTKAKKYNKKRRNKVPIKKK